MKSFSNKYIFIYATVLVVIVATVLSTTAVVLKHYQTKNINTEKIQNLLAAVNIEASFDEAENMYKEYFKEELAINKNGDVVSRYDVASDKLEGDVRPFSIDVKKHQALLKSGEDVVFPLYVYEKDGQKGYVIPLQGSGLWGDIWGNIALAADFNSVVGVNLSKEKNVAVKKAETKLTNYCETCPYKPINYSKHIQIGIHDVKLNGKKFPKVRVATFFSL